MLCYATFGTPLSVLTACDQIVSRNGHWTTAAAAADCTDCLASDAWKNRDGRHGVGDPNALAPDAPEVPSPGSTFV